MDHDYRLFARILDMGSLSAAGRELGLSPAAASKRLAALEHAAGRPADPPQHAPACADRSGADLPRRCPRDPRRHRRRRGPRRWPRRKPERTAAHLGAHLVRAAARGAASVGLPRTPPRRADRDAARRRLHRSGRGSDRRRHPHRAGAALRQPRGAAARPQPPRAVCGAGLSRPAWHARVARRSRRPPAARRLEPDAVAAGERQGAARARRRQPCPHQFERGGARTGAGGRGHRAAIDMGCRAGAGLGRADAHPARLAGRDRRRHLRRPRPRDSATGDGARLCHASGRTLRPAPWER